MGWIPWARSGAVSIPREKGGSLGERPIYDRGDGADTGRACISTLCCSLRAVAWRERIEISCLSSAYEAGDRAGYPMDKRKSRYTA